MTETPTWPDLFRLWFGRIIGDPGWTLLFIADDDCANRAEVTYRHRYREATFRYRPSMTPSYSTAAHEVCHLAIARLYATAVDLTAQVDRDGFARKVLDGSCEETAEALARSFVRAYGVDGRAGGAEMTLTHGGTP